jgi:hypothetical protein
MAARTTVIEVWRQFQRKETSDMGQVQMRFTITWKGLEEAELLFLVDGGIAVVLAGKQARGNGSITIDYLTDNAGAHKIEWGLVFPNKTLESLAATASIAQGAAQNLNSSQQESQIWKSTGQAVG